MQLSIICSYGKRKRHANRVFQVLECDCEFEPSGPYLVMVLQAKEMLNNEEHAHLHRYQFMIKRATLLELISTPMDSIFFYKVKWSLHSVAYELKLDCNLSLISKLCSFSHIFHIKHYPACDDLVSVNT